MELNLSSTNRVIINVQLGDYVRMEPQGKQFFPFYYILLSCIHEILNDLYLAVNAAN